MALSLERSGWTALKDLWFCRPLRPPQQERDFGGSGPTLQLQGLRVSPFTPSVACDQPVNPVTDSLLPCPLISLDNLSPLVVTGFIVVFLVAIFINLVCLCCVKR